MSHPRGPVTWTEVGTDVAILSGFAREAGNLIF